MAEKYESDRSTLAHAIRKALRAGGFNVAHVTYLSVNRSSDARRAGYYVTLVRGGVFDERAELKRARGILSSVGVQDTGLVSFVSGKT